MTSVEQLIGGRIGSAMASAGSRGWDLGLAPSDRVSVETVQGNHAS